MPLVLVHAVLWIDFYGFEVVDYDVGSVATSREGAPLFEICLIIYISVLNGRL
ncbi:hypothetical protein AHAS_Ahas15G0206800 [Arachis hypogaea]